jgi:colanic acid/amylovoran biosynthesis glycosyltransferase
MEAKPDNKTRVAIFRHTLYKQSEQFIPMQALALLNSEVTMIARDEVVNPVSGLNTLSLQNIGTAIKLRHTVFADTRPLKYILEKGNFNVVHAHFGVEGLYSYSAAQELDIPHFTTLHGYDVTLSDLSLLSSTRPAWLRYGLKRRQFLSSLSNFICVSSYIQQKAIELGADHERTHVVGTGVDTQAISPSQVPSDPVVLHVARLVEKKGTSILISAFFIVLRKLPEAQLRIIGDGPLMSELKSKVEILGISHNVTFLGNQPHHIVLTEMRNARLFCLPSITARSGDAEGLGQVLLEASACARPVLATNSGGISDVVVDGATGMLIDEGNTRDLAEAMYEYLSNWNLASAHGLSGREHIENHFDVYRQALKIEMLYRRA